MSITNADIFAGSHDIFRMLLIANMPHSFSRAASWWGPAQRNAKGHSFKCHGSTKPGTMHACGLGTRQLIWRPWRNFSSPSNTSYLPSIPFLGLAGGTVWQDPHGICLLTCRTGAEQSGQVVPPPPGITHLHGSLSHGLLASCIHSVWSFDDSPGICMRSSFLPRW